MEKKYWEKSKGWISAICDICEKENTFKNGSNGELFHRKFVDLATDGSHADDICLVTLCHECYMKIMS